jgi:transcription elongation factor Elf1
VLVRDRRRELTCCRCGLTIDTRVARYTFILIADRGRGGSSVKPDLRTLVCGPCGDSVRSELESLGLLGVMSSG